jgi:aminoglycoside phosphotransferase (APT) family kinase protein
MTETLSLGTLALGWQVAAAAGRIASDRVGASLGRALPTTPEEFAREDVINALLRSGAPDGAAPLPPVARVRLPGVVFESSNCQNFLVELEFAGGATPGLPETAYVKLPCRSLTTRVFANALGFWALECAFCRTLAHRMPIRVPRVYAVAQRGSRFALLLENMRAVPGVQLFINRDMAAGTTPERAARALSTLAELHAGFWEWDAARREALLPAALHPFLPRRRRAMSRALLAAAIGPCRSRAPDVFSPQLAALCRRALARWDDLIAWWYQGPLTLVHGDSHLGNLFEIDGPEGSQMGMLDFQAVHWSKGMRDVQYHLIHSLAPDVLAAHESSLIDHYVAELARRGIALDAELAREQYRAFSFQTLLTDAVSFAGGLTEREAVVRTVLERSTAAVERLRFAEWLESL